MKEREELISLFEIYKDLFTEKQQLYFKNYYYEDLSLSEISDNIKVSRAIIGRTIKEVSQKLKKYESILHVKALQDKIKEIG